eukprot:6456412-Amphidinium_carterae.1
MSSESTRVYNECRRANHSMVRRLEEEVKVQRREHAAHLKRLVGEKVEKTLAEVDEVKRRIEEAEAKDVYHRLYVGYESMPKSIGSHCSAGG